MSTVKTTLKFDLRQIETTPARDWNRISPSRLPSVRFLVSANGSSTEVRAFNSTALPFIYTGETDLEPNSTYEVVAEVINFDGVGNTPIRSEAQTITTDDTEEYINIMMYFKLKNTAGAELAVPAGLVLEIFDTEAARNTGTSPVFSSEGSLDNNLAAGNLITQIDFPRDGLDPNHACFIQRIGKNTETPSTPYNYWLKAEIEFGGVTYRYQPTVATNLNTAGFRFFHNPDDEARPTPFTVYTLGQV